MIFIKDRHSILIQTRLQTKFKGKYDTYKGSAQDVEHFHFFFVDAIGKYDTYKGSTQDFLLHSFCDCLL